MALHKWEAPPSPTTYLSTELNSLANGARILGAAIDNKAAKALYITVHLNLAAQGAARSAGAHVTLYFLPSTDGTNYTYGDSALDPPETHARITLPLDATAAARHVISHAQLFDPHSQKILLKNSTGQAFVATGNILTYTLHSLETPA